MQPNPPLQQTGRTWRRRTHGTTHGGRLLNAMVVSLASLWRWLSAVGLVLVATGCVAQDTSELGTVVVSINGERQPRGSIREQLSQGLSQGGKPFVTLRLSCGTSVSTEQQLLTLAWASGAEQVVLERCAAIGSRDAEFIVRPSVVTRACTLGSTTAEFIIAPPEHNGRFGHALIPRPTSVPQNGP